MRILITERQYKLLEEEQKTLKIPFEVFNNDWNKLQNFLNKKGNPPYEIIGDLNLNNTPIEALGNLTSVGGSLDLVNTPIKSLGNLTSVGGNLVLRNTPIESLGNLTSVGGYLNLRDSSIKSLGNLTSVGGYLDLRKTPMSEKYSEEEIRQMVNVEGKIYL